MTLISTASAARSAAASGSSIGERLSEPPASDRSHSDVPGFGCCPGLGGTQFGRGRRRPARRRNRRGRRSPTPSILRRARREPRPPPARPRLVEPAEAGVEPGAQVPALAPHQRKADAVRESRSRRRRSDKPPVAPNVVQNGRSLPAPRTVRAGFRRALRARAQPGSAALHPGPPRVPVRCRRRPRAHPPGARGHRSPPPARASVAPPLAGFELAELRCQERDVDAAVGVRGPDSAPAPPRGRRTPCSPRRARCRRRRTRTPGRGRAESSEPLECFARPADQDA